MHKNFIALALLTAVLVMFSVAAAPQKPQGVLAPLKVGQAVALQDRGGSQRRHELGMLAGLTYCSVGSCSSFLLAV